MYKTHLKQWLVFSKRDRTACIILLFLIGVIVVLPYFFTAKKTEIHIDAALQAELEQYLLNNSRQSNQPGYASSASDTAITDTIRQELFYFDPNTLNEEGFVKLGLPPK